jgi:uncharacterized protein (TIGR03435 family)
MIALGSGRVVAQAAADRASTFEVASIRVHENADDPSETNLLSGGRYEGKNVSLRKLIRQATGVDDEQMLGVPDWADSVGYDIEARTGETSQLQPEEFQRLLLGLLEDRFGFQFHRETRTQSVFQLVAKKGGPKLKVHEGEGQPAMSVNGGPGRKVLIATGVSMRDLAGLLSRQSHRPVEDHTGLSGTYDMKLEWDESQAAESNLPSLFGAVEEQLGLKLVPGKGQAEIVVVDRVERPSQN